MATYNIKEAIKAQEQYCEEHELPHFAPRSGVCWYCHQNIYSENGFTRFGEKTSGISVEGAGSHMITGCPFCYRSYCD